MITIKIWQNPDGSVSCDSQQMDGDLTGNDVITAIGMLESVKMSMLAGRWGVLDAQKKKGVAFPAITRGYKRKRVTAGKPEVQK